MGAIQAQTHTNQMALGARLTDIVVEKGRRGVATDREEPRYL